MKGAEGPQIKKVALKAHMRTEVVSSTRVRYSRKAMKISKRMIRMVRRYKSLVKKFLSN